MPRSFVLVLLVVFVACRPTGKGDTSSLSPKSGQDKNDDLAPLINSKGDTLTTGVAHYIVGRKLDPAKFDQPTIKPAGPPIEHQNTLNAHPIPDDISVRIILRDSLKKFIVSESNSDFVCISSTGDTIPTGELIAAKSHKVLSLHPQPTKALTPSLSFNARSNMQFLDVEHGLANPYVPTMLEDRLGNMWFGTFGGGLSKYNGETFTTYTTENGLAHNSIYDIMEDKNGRIWCCTYGGGVSIFNGEYFAQFTEDDGLCSNATRSITEDSKGNIWIGTDGGGVSKYDGKSFTNYSTKQGLAENSVRTILEDSEGAIWIGTTGGGVCKLEKQEVNGIEQEIFTHYTKEDGLCNNYINLIIEDAEGSLWFACNGGGVSKLTRPEAGSAQEETITNYTEKEGLCGRMVYSLLADQKGNMWFGTYSDGLSQLITSGTSGYKGESFVNYTTEDGLSSDEIYSIEQDSKGNIWFCTWGGGLVILKNQSFKQYTTAEGLPHIRVYDIQDDKDGNLWISTDGGGLSKLVLNESDRSDIESVTSFQWEQGLLSSSPKSIIKDQQGNIWTGGTRGVSMFNEGAKGYSQSTITNYVLRSGTDAVTLRDLTEDAKGDLWFATNDGLRKFSPAQDESSYGEFTSYTEEEGLSSNSLHVIIEDTNGAIWIGSDFGLSKLTAKKENRSTEESIIHLSEHEGLVDNNVQDLLEDNNGNIWIATKGGLSILNNTTSQDGQTFSNYTIKEGLTSNNVTTLTLDETGNIWVGTAKGLNLIVLNEMPSSETKPISRNIKEIKTYSSQDGLKGDDIIPRSSHIDSRNRMWMGTQKGLFMLDLNEFVVAAESPDVQFTSLAINERFIDFHNQRPNDSLGYEFSNSNAFYNYPEDLRLDHDKDHLTFHFAAIDWTAAHKIKYSYQMEGLEDAWSMMSQESKADYRNIPPGNYAFKVRAIGESNEWSEASSYPFEILPPWYLTWWMYLLYGLVLIGAAAIFSRWRSMELLKKNMLLEHTVKNRTVEIQQKNELLSQQTEQLLQLDVAKTQLYTNITHEFRTPLTVIKGMTDSLLANSEVRKLKDTERSLELIGRNGSKLLQLVNEMLDLAKLESGNMELDLQQSDIVPYVKYLSESYHSLAQQKNVSLNVYAEIEHLEMDFDAKKLASIISNLISNAIKYTSNPGKISVYLNTVETLGNEHFSIKVNDTGIGLSAEDIPNVFDKFYQVNDSSTRQGEGTGIGLSLVKEIVEVMQGTITVESILGVGSSFTVQLPISNVAKIVEVPLPKASSGVEELHSQSTEEVTEAIENSDLPLALLIEDNADVAYYIENCLKGEYFTIYAENGKLGVDIAFEHIPDIIISDVMMPEMDGFEACSILKQDERTNHIPIILLTAKATSDDKLSGLSHGADAYLIKPFEKQELLLRMSKLMEIRKTLQFKYSQVETTEVKEQVIENSFVKRFYEIVETHILEEDFSIEELADKLHLSRSQVHRKIKGLTGMSTSLYVRHIRLQKANKLLTSTDLNISEVAYQTGFKTPVYFSQVFKETFGTSPSEARKNR